MKRIHSNDLKNIETFDETNWTSKSFVMSVNFSQNIRNLEEPLSSKNVIFCDRIPKPSQYLISPDKYKNLISVKNQIDDIRKDKRNSWNRWVHLLNPYEKIGSFSNIDPSIITSRAFYKLYELIIFYNLESLFKEKVQYSADTTHSVVTSLHLCEAPGGFISAMKYIFKERLDWYAHTLYTGADSLKIDQLLNDRKRWLASSTDGDLYKLDTILQLKKELPERAHIITADGGFDVSYDANSQEQLSFKLIFAQFLAALHMQREEGVFILKIFDTFTRPTYQLMYLFCKYYKSVEIIKPRTSRSSNSEKYIIAIGFRGIPQDELSELNKIMVLWGDRKYCKNFGFPQHYNMEDAEKLRNYNDFLSVNQSWYIHKSLCCLKYFDKQISSRETSQFNPNNLEALQNKRALEFCIAFGLRPVSNSEGYGKANCSEKCTHIRVTKIEHEEVKNVVKCNRCMKLLIGS